MVFGLALVLALVLGMATMALAAVPGDPFKLGKINSINRVSTLVGSVAGPLLKVDNNGGGAALRLEANTNRPPLTVNADAGKAPNLNADKIDGMEASALLPGGDLPRGRTVQGSYVISDKVPANSSGIDASAISFGYKLASTPTVRFIVPVQTPPPECPGTVDSPEAAPGYLCVYEVERRNVADGSPYFHYVGRHGATLFASSSYNSSTSHTIFQAQGSWAVTGN